MDEGGGATELPPLAEMLLAVEGCWGRGSQGPQVCGQKLMLQCLWTVSQGCTSPSKAELKDRKGILGKEWMWWEVGLAGNVRRMGELRGVC